MSATPAISTSSSVGLVGDFEERSLCVRAQSRPPSVKIGAVDEGRGDAEARQQLLDHIEARAEQSPRGDDVVAGPELAHERGGDGGHPARRRPRRLGALEQRHPPLEHRNRRIGEARIDEARILALEARLRQLHRVVEIALGQKEGLGRLIECRTQRSAMDQLRRGPQRLGITGFSRARHRSSPLRRRRLMGSRRGDDLNAPRSFSPLFNVAASRSAQMTTGTSLHSARKVLASRPSRRLGKKLREGLTRSNSKQPLGRGCKISASWMHWRAGQMRSYERHVRAYCV